MGFDGADLMVGLTCVSWSRCFDPLFGYQDLIILRATKMARTITRITRMIRR